ncbi:MAG: hypothetical protein FJW34_08705 [Acidobacteria bacterium]|nr:hypothetical protein [Acidobacteriota bacterium]
MRIVLLATAALLVPWAFSAVAQNPKAADPITEVSGRITKVELVRGQGMPSLEVKAADGRTWRIWLGSMRYLVERGFNPKAGQQVTSRGYEKPGVEELMAYEVSLPETRQTLRLRDESGKPLWRGGRRGQR